MSTTTRKKTTKAAARPKAAPVSAGEGKEAPAAKTAAPKVAPKATAAVLGPLMRKKELIERVVARSGIKKKDAKPVVEAMLAELGEALAENRELALPPLGKLRVKRERNLPNGRMMVVKMRQSSGGSDTPETEDAE